MTLDELRMRRECPATTAQVVGSVVLTGRCLQALAAAAYLAAHGVLSYQKAKWARERLLPQIEKLAQDIPWTGEGPHTWAAFELATQAEQYIPDDALLQRLEGNICAHVKLSSSPPGARVYAKPYAADDSHWRYLGQTPADNIRLAIGF